MFQIFRVFLMTMLVVSVALPGLSAEPNENQPTAAQIEAQIRIEKIQGAQGVIKNMQDQITKAIDESDAGKYASAGVKILLPISAISLLGSALIMNHLGTKRDRIHWQEPAVYKPGTPIPSLPHGLEAEYNAITTTYGIAVTAVVISEAVLVSSVIAYSMYVPHDDIGAFAKRLKQHYDDFEGIKEINQAIVDSGR